MEAPHIDPAHAALDHACRSTGFRDARILARRDLAESIVELKLDAPILAARAQAGQFVVVRMDERAERIPLTIVDFDAREGWLTIIFQAVGASTRRLATLHAGGTMLDLVGPLGEPTKVEKYGTVVCVGGGVGVAPVYPIVRALRAAGNRVVSIIGARSKDLLILEDEMRAASDELVVCTDDGSQGRHGFVTDALKDRLDGAGPVARIWAIGPVVMMNAVCRVTEPYQVHTEVSLNSIMVDGTGMCGGCRVTVAGDARFVCVDGPEFDGHQVDFKELMKRQGIYRSEENLALWDYAVRSGAVDATGEKLKHRIDMPRQDPRVRITNFDEVALGYTESMARAEAGRCLQCKKRPCTRGCPVEVPIPEFVKSVAEGRFLEAAQRIKNVNSLPAVCGRVCPQESQCEEVCVLAKKGRAVAVGRLERFAADYEANLGDPIAGDLPAPTGRRVAVVGSGPAGLTCAADLARMGHAVEVFEAFHQPGGVLVYGIPEFRLPKRIVAREVEFVKTLGVRVHTSYIVGKAVALDELFARGFDAVFLGTGAGLPYFLGVPGENLNGVYSANEFLTRVNLMKAYKFPAYDTPVRIAETMAVIGGGNVAMDAARVSLRLGAKKVLCIYRRSRAELPARAEEVENAEEEGVDFRLLTNPIRFLDDGNGWLAGIECMKMELGEPDASGRRRPVAIPGSEYVVPVQVAIVAIGQGPNPLLTRATKDLALNRHGNIVADAETGATSLQGVYAGGDIVTGAATVILAMGAGKKAARAIDRYLTGAN
jgi:glutamate synthase (NADPH/NADH) small chain